MRTIILTYLLISSISSFAHKEYFYFLHGTVGNRSIALRIEQYDEMWFAKFFYTELKKDALLKGSCDSLGCQFSTYKWVASEGKEVMLESLFITEQPDHTWKGKWIGIDKKNQAIFLRPIKIDYIKHLYNKQPVVKTMDPYSYFRTHDLKFIKIKSENINSNYKIDWCKEVVSGLIFPRLKSGFTKTKRNNTNNTLEGLHIKELESYFSCSAVGHSEYALKAEITFINNSLINLTKEVKYNCQSEQTSVEKFNLAIATDNGDILDLEDIFWMGNGNPPRAESQPWYNYRYTVFGSTIKNILTQLYPEMMKPKQGCSYEQPSVWQFPTWQLSAKGLYVGAFFPGIDRTCDAQPWSIIPFKNLDAYKNPRFTF